MKKPGAANAAPGFLLTIVRQAAADETVGLLIAARYSTS